MRAVLMDGYGGPGVLRVGTVPDPEPGPGEVRIRIKFAGVNPVDVKIREGLLKDRLPNQFPIIPGWDAAGIVDKAGPDATTFPVGSEVYAYCRKPVIQFGTYAEFVVVPESFVAWKPKSVSIEEASVIPLAGLTAWQSLFDVAGLKSGQSILIHAAAGGVGGYAVQFARAAGAHVIATCRGGNAGYVRALGAAEIIDYTAGDFRNGVRDLLPDGVDIAFDTVGGEVQVRSADAVRKGGTLVSLLAYQNEAALRAKGIETKYHFCVPSGAQLATIAEWVDAGRMRPFVSEVFKLKDAAEAQERIASRHVRGKLALAIG